MFNFIFEIAFYRSILRWTDADDFEVEASAWTRLIDS